MICLLSSLQKFGQIFPVIASLVLYLSLLLIRSLWPEKNKTLWKTFTRPGPVVLCYALYSHCTSQQYEFDSEGLGIREFVICYQCEVKTAHQSPCSAQPRLTCSCSDVLHSGARDIILASQSFHQELTCNTSEVQRGRSLLIDLARSSLAENFRNEGRKSSFILVWYPKDSASSSLLPWFWLIHNLIKFVWWNFCFCGGWHARRCLNPGCH